MDEDGSEIELRNYASLETSVKSALSYLRAAVVERRSSNPKMRVQISVETANFSLFSAVSDTITYLTLMHQ